MIFESRHAQCQACKSLSMCKWSEIYYENKGEWPHQVPQDMVDSDGECAHAPKSRFDSFKDCPITSVGQCELKLDWNWDIKDFATCEKNPQHEDCLK